MFSVYVASTARFQGAIPQVLTFFLTQFEALGTDGSTRVQPVKPSETNDVCDSN